HVTLGAVAVNCGSLTASASVSAAVADLNAANNSAASSAIPVSELPLSQLLLSIEPVSKNNNLLRLHWPVTCRPFTLEALDSLNPPSVWTTVALPIQTTDNLHCTIIPADQAMKYFRVRLP